MSNSQVNEQTRIDGEKEYKTRTIVLFNEQIIRFGWPDRYISLLRED